MENRGNAHNEINLDTKLLSNFIIELNLSLRLVTSYPKNHPIIASSIKKVLGVLEDLLEYREEITIGVARDTLMVEYAVMDPKNPVYGNLARILFDHDIAAVAFKRNATSEELLRFSGLLLRKREEIRRCGGIEQAARESGICNILVKRINYSYFRTTEECLIAPVAGNPDKKNESSMWENFVHGLLGGTLDPNEEHAAYTDTLDPGVLADMMNDLDYRSVIKMERCSETIASFVDELELRAPDVRNQNDTFEKFNSFVGRLNPELRRKFLNGTFTCLGQKRNLTEDVLDAFSDDVVLDVLEDINSRMTYAPPLTVNLLQRLSKNPVTHGTAGMAFRSKGELDHDRLGEKLRIIFREDERDEFVPSAYQKTLQAITSSDGISIPELENIEELRQSLLSHSVETHICRIILEIMREPPEEFLPEALEQNLLELVDYLLELGDFTLIAEIYDQLINTGSDTGNDSRSCSPKLRESFTGGEFIEKLLNCLNSWDKAKHPEIRNLINRIGSPFIEPLLELLAEEQNMSLRRSYIDCLLDQGDKIREAVISRLGDKRWYFVRNLIVILRELDDSSVLKYIRRLRNHPHPKIRQEVIRTFQHFSHPEADRFLILDMNGSDRELQFNAIQLAEKSKSPEVFERLLVLMNSRGYTNADFEIKTALVRTLAQIRNSEALPVLMRIIRSRYFLRPQAYARLRAEIISSLGSYPADAVMPLLEKLSASGNKELARVAREALNNVQGER